MSITAYPLQWPPGWKRTAPADRVRAKFGTARTGNDWGGPKPLTIAQGADRVRLELKRLGVSDDDTVISTNLTLRLDGRPRSDQGEPKDPGACVYWIDSTGARRCMPVDRYDRVADNLAAIAATLEAMRAIERHGGAQVLERAFTGFVALPAPGLSWRDVLGVEQDSASSDINAAYRRLRSKHHPDNGGDPDEYDRVQKAWKQYLQEPSEYE